MIATVVPILRLRRATSAWSYKIPSGISCQIGSLVVVPFRGRNQLGIIWEIEKENEKATESIDSVLTHQPLLRAQHRAFIAWRSDVGFISLSSALYGWLPAALRSYPLTKLARNLVETHDSWNPTPAYMAVQTQQILLTPSERPESTRLLEKKYPGQVLDTFQKRSHQGELEQWFNVLYGTVRVILGREKALAAPCLNLRHVLIQEPEDIAYYHEQLPYLSLVEAGEILGSIWSAQTTLRSYLPQEPANTLWPNQNILGSTVKAIVQVTDLHREPILNDILLTHLSQLQPDQTALLLYNAHDRLVTNADASKTTLPGIETLRKQLAKALGRERLPETIVLGTRQLFSTLHKNVGLTAILSIDPLLNAQNFADMVHGWGDLGHLLAFNAPCIIQTKHPDHPLVSALRNQRFPEYCQHSVQERKSHHLPPFATTIMCSNPLQSDVEKLYTAIESKITSTSWKVSHPFLFTWRKKEQYGVMIYNETPERLPRPAVVQLSALSRPWKVQRNPWFIL